MELPSVPLGGVTEGTPHDLYSNIVCVAMTRCDYVARGDASLQSEAVAPHVDDELPTSVEQRSTVPRRTRRQGLRRPWSRGSGRLRSSIRRLDRDRHFDGSGRREHGRTCRPRRRDLCQGRRGSCRRSRTTSSRTRSPPPEASGGPFRRRPPLPAGPFRPRSFRVQRRWSCPTNRSPLRCPTGTGLRPGCPGCRTLLWMRWRSIRAIL